MERTGNSSGYGFAFYIPLITRIRPRSPASYPAWSDTIRRHYWHLRHARGFDLARIRKEYRRIEVEKNRQLAAGIQPEGIRLLCRHLVNLANSNAASRWWSWLSSNFQMRTTAFEFGSYVIPELCAMGGTFGQKLQCLVPLQLSDITVTVTVTKNTPKPPAVMGFLGNAPLRKNCSAVTESVTVALESPLSSCFAGLSACLTVSQMGGRHV